MALVAVNSGSSLSKVADYVKKNQIAMPVIVDTDRSVERSAGLTNEISLKNIWQARVIKSDGTIVRTSAKDLDGAMEKAADGAAWNIEPATVPESMRSIWVAIEFGSYGVAAKPLAKFKNSRKKAEKEAAALLVEYINKQITTQIAGAEEDLASDPYSAWKKLTQIRSVFGAYKLPKSVKQNLSELEADDTVKTERQAMKQLSLARKTARGSNSAKKRAITLLKRLIEKYPDTEAATQAQELLNSTRAP